MLLLAAAIAIAVSGLASASTTTNSHSSARLVLKRKSPATVGGTGFKAHRTVSVKFVSAQTFVRHAVVNSQGAFTVTFPTVVDRCSGFLVTATQPGRASVMLRGRPLPECAPAQTP